MYTELGMAYFCLLHYTSAVGVMKKDKIFFSWYVDHWLGKSQLFEPGSCHLRRFWALSSR